MAQVLSDSGKRQVYDIYGKEGLASGLEVGTTVNNVDELKQKWAQFKAQEVSSTQSRVPLLQVHPQAPPLPGSYICPALAKEELRLFPYKSLHLKGTASLRHTYVSGQSLVIGYLANDACCFCCLPRMQHSVTASRRHSFEQITFTDEHSYAPAVYRCSTWYACCQDRRSCRDALGTAHT